MSGTHRCLHKIKRIALVVLLLWFSGFGLLCMYVFYQFLSDVDIVDIGQYETIPADEWFTIETDIEALNRSQNILMTFTGSSQIHRQGARVRLGEGVCGGTKTGLRTYLHSVPVLLFEAEVFDSEGVETIFCFSGSSGRELYLSEPHDSTLMGKTITQIKIRPNANLHNVELQWMSRTGK